jgi:hypothetical protein
MQPDKLLWFDYSGKYQHEMPIRRDVFSFLFPLGSLNGTLLFGSSGIPLQSGKPGIVEVPQTILAISEDSGELKSLASFPITAFIASAGGGSARSMRAYSLLTVVPFKEKYLALIHTCEYLLKIYDPAANAVLREFRRQYERVKQPPEKDKPKKGALGVDDKSYIPPEQKYANDVANIFARGGEIWAVTSTRDQAKGILIDVFDGDGVYQDAFYLQLPEAALAGLASPSLATLDGDFLYVIARNADETSTIRKYLIEK